MTLLKNDSEGFQIELTRDQALIIHQSLNEVCHGFRMDDFEKRVGKKESAILEMDILGSLIDSKKTPISIMVNLDQLTLYRNAVRETCREIDDWEFSTRIAGIKKSVALDLLKSLEKAVSS